ncbi:MAG: hypothetical protein ABI609_00845 [Acidobacteriota bacterium]
MSRPVALTLVCLSLFLLAFPLTVGKPGLPTNLKADEPAYYLMALSIARDHDLRADVRDIDRLFEEFPFGPTRNLILSSDDNWHTVHFGKPFAYSLIAAPFAALWGANGMVFCNMLMLVGMLWLSVLYLRRYNDDSLAALFAAGFFLMSTAFAYVFWLQPEVFNMACVTLCLFCGFRPADEGEIAGAVSAPPGAIAMAISGGALIPAVLNKPMFLALALPVLWVAWRGPREKRWGALGAWLGGATLVLAVLGALSIRATGHAIAYFGKERVGAVVCEPGKMPPMALPSIALPSAPVIKDPPAVASEAPPAGARPTAWSWIFRLPTIVWRELFENLGYFLWGRHTGLLLYLPFAAIATLLFVFNGRRSSARWVLLASLAMVALAFLILLPFNWHGGGGFLGNRYFVSVYPAFLFLLTRIRPGWLTAVGFALGGTFLGPVLFTPFGAPVPEGTLQAHVRNAPFRYFPLELSIRQVPGYESQNVSGIRVQGRRDVFLPQGEEWWLRGNSESEIWMSSAKPLDRVVFRVQSAAPDNDVDVEFAGEHQTVSFRNGAPAEARITFTPKHPDRLRSQDATPVYAYRLDVEPHRGRNQNWTRVLPPDTCPGFAYNPRIEDTFFLGARVLYLGSGEGLDADVFHLGWGAVNSPDSMAAGAHLPVTVELSNRSSTAWNPSARNGGAATVKLAYHWLTAEGATVEWDGRRAALGEVAPGGHVSATLDVVAPAQPGTYTLAIDALFEHVAWFSERGVGMRTSAVVVTPAATPTAN